MKRFPLKTAIILMGVLFAGLSAFFVTQLSIERDNDSMQSDLARADQTYGLFKKVFDAEHEVIITISSPELLSEKGVVQLEKFTRWLASLDGVRDSYSLMDIPQLDPSLLRSFFLEHAELRGGLVSEDFRTVGVLVELDSEQSRAARHNLLETLSNEASTQISGEVHVVGLPLLKESVARYIARDQRMVMPLSVAVMILILALLFRRPAGVILPMAVVGLSLVTTLGIYAACGFQLNSITSLLPPVIIVLSVSTAVHIFDAWQYEVDTGHQGNEAIRNTLSSVWKPCVFTVIMTAVGLLSLCISPIPAVRLFGVFAAVGVLFSLVFSFLVLPIGLGWVAEVPGKGTRPGCLMERFLESVSILPTRRPFRILAVAMIISLISLWFGAKVKNNTDLIQFFKKGSPTYIAHEEVNQSMGSVRALELMIRRKDSATLNTPEDLRKLDQFIDQLNQISGVIRTDSVMDFYQERRLSAFPSTPLMERLVSSDRKIIRVQIHLGNIGSAQAAKIVDQITARVPNQLGADYQVDPTGAYYQVVRDSNELVSTLLKSFSITLAIVLISTGLLFRSFSVLVPALIPNLLPILWGAGLMGLFGIDLSTGTTMVAAVVIGLAVDDTIHYLHHFQTFKSLPIQEATKQTTRRIGHALTASSIVLVGGFWTGAFGSFIPTNTFALLTGCTMISALFCDLLVLPAYLNIVLNNRQKNGASI